MAEEKLIALNSFKSVITSLTNDSSDVVYTAPKGVSTILLSAQVTNTGLGYQSVTIKIDSNKKIPVPQVESITNLGGFDNTRNLLEQNREFIKKETVAYINFINNLKPIPVEFEDNTLEEYIDVALTGTINDIANFDGGTLQTKKAASSFYSKNGKILIDENFIELTHQAIDYSKELIKQILNNQPVSNSENIERLYQLKVNQIIDGSLTISPQSIDIVIDLLSVISDNISNPIKEKQPPVDLVTNVTIPEGDSLSPIVAGKLVLEEEFSLVMIGSPEMKVVLSVLESANE